MSRNSAGSSSQQHFSQIPSANIQRSTFDRSSMYKTTFNAGKLIPFYADEVLPGDTIKLTANLLARLATPIFPYMDNLFLDVHYFFIPNRLVWDNWEKFNGAQDNPGDSTDFLIPQISAAPWPTGFGELGLFDYLGLPTKVPLTQENMPNALVPRAYNLVYDEWYRDENLQDSVGVETGDGPDTEVYPILNRGRRKDYFTSALPWPQKGPSVLLPIGSTAPVFADGNTTIQLRGQGSGNTGQMLYQNSPNNLLTTPALSNNDPVGFNGPGIDLGLYADLSEATAATINELRQAFTIQQMFEKDARGGTRYVELLLAHFGVVSPDFRLQRPEYLGGGTVSINVNPIAQTSETDASSPQGNLAAFAVATGRVGFNHSFVEHGHVLGIMSVRADTTYQQGMNRMWSRRTRFDFYWPTLAHLGEQPIFNKEIMAQGTSADNGVFGYQERFAEYRYKPSIVTGKFRSNATGTLDAWHLAMDFDTLPTLAGLVPENPPVDRIIAVPSEPHFIVDTYCRQMHTRPMPTYSVPGLSKL